METPKEMELKDLKTYDLIQIDLSSLSKRELNEIRKIMRILSGLNIPLNITEYTEIRKQPSKDASSKKGYLEFKVDGYHLLFLIILYYKFFGRIAIRLVRHFAVCQLPYELFDLEIGSTDNEEFNDVESNKQLMENFIKTMDIKGNETTQKAFFSTIIKKKKEMISEVELNGEENNQ